MPWQLVSAILLVLWPALLSAQSPTSINDPEPLHRTLGYNGQEREYHLRLPEDHDPGRTYWLLVVAHGGGGNWRRYLDPYRYWSDQLGLDAVVVAPSFRTEGRIQYYFPSLGEGAFLKAVIKDLRQQYRLHPKFLLVGYSAGGAFSHRFALQNPDLVQACAALGMGTRTTPDGRFFIRGLGEIKQPHTRLRGSPPALEEGDRRKLYFQPAVARVASQPARPGASRIPFLVMCGTLDIRLPDAKAFSASLKDSGFHCETAWPRTGHWFDDKTREEFQKFFRKPIAFFVNHIDSH